MRDGALDAQLLHLRIGESIPDVRPARRVGRLLRSSNHSRLDLARSAAAISSFSASRFRPRNAVEAKRGSVAIFSRSISLQNF
jgi:hypothetical protein